MFNVFADSFMTATRSDTGPNIDKRRQCPSHEEPDYRTRAQRRARKKAGFTY